jgi:hypothetical protein
MESENLCRNLSNTAGAVFVARMDFELAALSPQERTAEAWYHRDEFNKLHSGLSDAQSQKVRGARSGHGAVDDESRPVRRETLR